MAVPQVNLYLETDDPTEVERLDEARRRLGADLLQIDGVTEVPQIIKALRWGEIYALLESATDKGENIGHTLEGIMIKYA